MTTRRTVVFFGVLLLALCVPMWAQSGSAASIPSDALMQPQALNQMLHANSGLKPLIVQVGSRLLFSEAHIPGSQYAGPGSQPEGLRLLEKAASSVPKDHLIVLYCGCCPWDRCPNIAPAWKKLHDLGYTKVKALYLAQNFGEDWVNKGYATQQ